MEEGEPSGRKTGKEHLCSRPGFGEVCLGASEGVEGTRLGITVTETKIGKQAGGGKCF